MKNKIEYHEALYLMFHRDGVLLRMIVDGLKEQDECDCELKCKQDGCYLKQTDLYSPWQNSAKGGIKEAKSGTGHKLFKARSPKRLWDYCAELESYIHSHKAQNIY